MTIPLIYIKGDPFQRGLTYGELARDQIRLVYEEYKILFDKEANLSWQAAEEKAMLYNNVIHEQCPDLVEEIDGVAKGCGMHYVDILTLNCCAEILYPNLNCASTTIGVPPEISGNGKTYLAQNCNWSSLAQGTLVVLEIDQDPHPNLLILTEAGLIGGCGINSHGLAICHNSLPIKKNSIGLPFPFLMRKVFSEVNVANCIESLAMLPKSLGACFTMASSKGTMMAMESSPDVMGMLLSKGEPLCHTNHWLSPAIPESLNTLASPIMATYTRLDWAMRLASEKAGKMGKKNILQILSEHASLSDCECVQENFGLPMYLKSSTVCSMVIDATNKILWIAYGKSRNSNVTGYRFAK
ncbi:MAG: C45 family peptidase [Burkholderiales bacterium]|nr:C45 family peptidase [Burkholderiales bacterium]